MAWDAAAVNGTLRLWICLSSLPLEVFRPNWPTELAVAVLGRERVHMASPLAMAADVKPAMRRGGVQTIAPQTILFDRDGCAELAALERVTMAMLQFSPNVAASEEAAVLADVSTTLRLFGGVRKLRQRMLAAARAMGFSPVARTNRRRRLAACTLWRRDGTKANRYSASVFGPGPATVENSRGH
ncbi:hypothetical protein [Cupriavidus necator]